MARRGGCGRSGRPLRLPEPSSSVLPRRSGCSVFSGVRKERTPARKDLLRVRNAVQRENLLGAANAACGHRCSPARGLPQGTDERINSAPHAALCPRAQGGIRVAFRTDQQRTACRPVLVGSGRYSGRVPVSRKNVQGRANAACRQRSPTDRTSFRRNVRTLEEKVKHRSVFIAPHAALCPRAQGGIQVNFYQRSTLVSKTG